jgi:hypothetical protein
LDEDIIIIHFCDELECYDDMVNQEIKKKNKDIRDSLKPDPSIPHIERYTGEADPHDSNACQDGIDNDYDGTTDMEDRDCRQAEYGWNPRGE